ncbi:6-aminohexanoate-dimer hydrolase [Novosphingobium nitrogenifigens DSM 19370]|uniref:6-aminohexanoate-dimer hydrolase n=1 Tax=Novosphingobium nitrogenifigens DSM 19370 TaxID=983920 RepID=F1Z9M7_9SPHN|nr:serine hydrolase [Novosphingobium nitrogenifigens]EGD58715.1 6-aminohexanoate-dimer hydrolase [Novosphingobium nitrogenifigens DSM 19370]
MSFIKKGRLAAGIALGLVLPCVSVSAQTAPAHVLPDGTVPPALKAARMHILDAPENMLTFHNMDQLFETRPVPRSGPVAPFAHSDKALPDAVIGGTTMTEDAWEDRTYTAALLVMRDGHILHESYRDNTDASTHFISFSMAKTITSMLIGIAVGQGAIHSIDQPATDFVPELKGSGYDGVTIRQLLQMRSGVDYEERYDFGEKPSVPAQIFLNAIVANKERFADMAPRLGRKWKPGSHFNYSTLDTSVLGWVLERATKRPLADFMTQYLWQPMGMESYGYWLADGAPGVGRELNGMGYNATLRDFARLGQMMLDKGAFNGRQIVPADWVGAATTMTPNADPGTPPPPASVTSPFARSGYGFQIWKLDETGAYTALGLQGQFIYVHPATRTVIVKLSFFPPEGSAEGDRALEDTLAYFGTLTRWKG